MGMTQQEKDADLIHLDDAADISVEEFDALEGEHIFSYEYQKRKKQMRKEYKKSLFGPSRRMYAKLAVAAVPFLVFCIPLMADAAANSAFFGWIWGNTTKENIKSHKEQIYDEQELPFTHTFPAREYVPVDPEKAKDLIGSYISNQKIVKELGDTTLTVLSCVSDGNAAIMEFTLEREGGVNAFHYSQLENEYHGAAFTQDAAFWFHFPECAENIYVDMERSTKDRLYCYNYMAMNAGAYDADTKGIVLEVNEYPCTRGELFAADEETLSRYLAQTVTSNLTVSIPALAETKKYVNADGGTADISPLAVKIDTDTGLGLEAENEILYDQNNIYYVSVNYKDETNYIVLEHNLQGKHACDTERDNSSCISYDTQGSLIVVFNRLVDTGSIASITVNETTYTHER